MKFTMRHYQKRFCRDVVDAFEGKVHGMRFTKVLATAATGAGKTVMASALMEHWTVRQKNKALFLADTDELCDQAVEAIHESAGLFADLEKASSRASRQANVVVGSIQTISQAARLKGWDPSHFGYVIADEAHMSMADGWQRVLKHFHKGGAKILGITATPERGDKKSLMKFYEHLAAEIPMAELIRERHLSPILVETVPLEIRITSEIGDGDNEAVGAEMVAYYGAIIERIKAHAADRRKILVFHPSVAASKAFTSLLREAGETARHVDGSSPDRKEVVEGFKQGHFRFLNNCQMLTKGFDCRDIDCVIVLRPTKGRTPYVQMVGRGTRLFCPHGCSEWCDHPDRKQNMLLLDFLWEFATHDVMGPADLMTDSPRQRQAVADYLKKGKPTDLIDADIAAMLERESELLDKLRANAGRRGERLDAMTFAAIMHQPELMDFEPVAAWEKHKPTEMQRKFMDRMGVDSRTVTSLGQAFHIVAALKRRNDFNLADMATLEKLLLAGVPDADRLTKWQAEQLLTA